MRKAILRCLLVVLGVGVAASTALASSSQKATAASNQVIGTSDVCSPDSCKKPAPDADPNATLSLGTIGAPAEWDVHNGRSPAQDQIFMSPVYDELLQLDAQGVPKPELATSYKMSKNQETMTLQLHKGVTFADGSPFNAKAVVVNEAYAKKTKGLGATNLASNFVKSVQATGPFTVVFHLSKPNPTFPINLAYNYSIGGMASPKALTTDPKSLATKPDGSGPYQLVSENVTQVTFKKNPSYWNKPQWEQLPQTLVFKQITDDNTRLAAVQTGQLDGGYEYNPIPGIDKFVAKSKGQIVKFAIPQTFNDALMLLNYKAPALRNADVREAMSLAINRGAICKNIYLGTCTPAIQPLSKGTLGYVPGLPYTSASFNPSKAKQILAKSGVASSDLALTMFAPQDPLAEKLDPVVQSELNAVGFNITLKPVPTPLAPTDWGEGQADMWLSNVSGNPNVNETLQNDYLIPPNMPGGSDPKLTPVFNKANAAPIGSAARSKGLQAVSKYVTNNHVDIIIGQVPNVYLPRSFVGGMSTMATAQIGIAYQARYLYVKKH